MSELPKKAKVVVIGAGIVGNSMVYHLAKLGWTDMVLVDKGPLPNPGGSTGHASNFIFPVDRTEERMEEFRRRMASARSWGIEAKLITPEEIKELVHYINEKILLGGFYTPSVGVVDSLHAGTLMRNYATEKGVLSVFPNTEVTDLGVEDGRIKSVTTEKGTIETEYVVICGGVWSPRLAEMAGVTVPLMPAVHQMLTAGPIPMLKDTKGEIEYPIVRDMDPLMYERQSGDGMEVGSYAHRPILMEPDDIPSIEESALSPTELPFTEDDFAPQMEDAMELMPEILADENVGVRHAINGLLSLTADGYPMIGEIPGVKNLWSVAAIWIKEAPGFGRAAAELMTQGYSEIDVHASDISRCYDYARTKTHVIDRTSEGWIKTYGIVHPREQWNSSRNMRVSPFYPREVELGAVFFETAGWERPQWYASNEKLLEKYGDKINDRPHEWDARWWSKITNAEHLAMRESVAMVDLTAFAIFDISGPGALDYVENLAVNKMDVPVGRAVYTPLLAPNGGFKADLTIMRTGADSFRVVTGGGDGARDKKWFTDHLPEDGSVLFEDKTSAICTVGLWGPNARKLLEKVTRDDVSDEGFPYSTAKTITIGAVKAWALRISYVGELGWEISAPMEHGLKLWDTLWAAGQEFGVTPVGIGVYGTTGRLEKGYRLMSAELETEYNPVEAGLARKFVKKHDFIGKEAYLKAREGEPAAILCTLTVDDHTSKSGVRRYMQGREPIVTLEGEAIVDSHGRRSYVTTAGNGPSVGKYILLAYLPPEYAKEGTKLGVMYMEELYPVTVAVAGSTPLFDPKDERMKC